MAVYIQIRKTSETDTEAVYEFLPDADENRAGKLVIDKLSGEIKQLESDVKDDKKFYFSRAARKVHLHHQKGEYPDNTCWAS
jgi:hypothetical protein